MNGEAMERAASGLLKQHEAAEYLRVSLRTFRRALQPRLPRVRFGRRVLFRIEDLDALATECTVEPVGSGRRRSTANLLAKAKALAPLAVREVH